MNIPSLYNRVCFFYETGREVFFSIRTKRRVYVKYTTPPSFNQSLQNVINIPSLYNRVCFFYETGREVFFSIRTKRRVYVKYTTPPSFNQSLQNVISAEFRKMGN